MNGNRTFTIIKPAAISNGNLGKILAIINEADFKIIALKMLRLPFKSAEEFYIVHKDKPFYKDLCIFMSSGPIVAAILEKENAIEDYRKLIGATNPEEAQKGTIRKLFATSMQQNAVHGSDSDENAIIESNFFFSGIERYN
jgi:nucleoside-diphosphate kinase